MSSTRTHAAQAWKKGTSDRKLLPLQEAFENNATGVQGGRGFRSVVARCQVEMKRGLRQAGLQAEAIHQRPCCR
eukprot:1861618-Amphidinium_carterae.1